jgi:thymidylate synthase (FAD)
MEEKSADSGLEDVMGGRDRIEEKVLDHGFVALVDLMPRLVPAGQTSDCAIVQAARTSYGRGTRKVNEDEGLIRYLMRHRHTTPFEFCELKFHARMPIFVARQWVRHRTASINECSARYSVVPDVFYQPDAEDIQQQSSSNKQGRAGAAAEESVRTFSGALADVSSLAYGYYQKAIEDNIARELARTILPINSYTEWYWKCNLHNLFHFLNLRMDSHAQMEIRVYAEAMYRLIKPLFPMACRAFEDYRLNSVELSALELDSIRSGREIETLNRREREEWEAKKMRIFGS